MSWTLTFTLPETITLNLSFIPWLILGYFFWGAIIGVIAWRNIENQDYTLDICILACMLIWPGVVAEAFGGQYAEMEEQMGDTE